MKLALIASLALAAVPARAQFTILGQKMDEVEQVALKSGKKLNSNEARAERVIGNIACVGDQAVSAVIDYAREKARIEFTPQMDPAGLVYDRKGPIVRLNEKLPDTPRVQIAYVVYEIAPLTMEDFPDSVEKEYMRVSLAARGWFELAGEASKLPVLDSNSGYKDASMGGLIKAWANEALTSSIAKSRPDLKSIQENGDDKTVQRWTEFRQAERLWRLANGFRFQQ